MVQNGSVPGLPTPRGIRNAALSVGVALDDARARALLSLAGLLEDVAVVRGFISAGDAGRVLERHVLDSLRAAGEFKQDDRVAYDIGSGAGLPGLVIAVAVPRCRVVLVESKARRVAFLEMAIERLHLRNAEAVLRRAEELSEQADVVTVRAFAPLDRSWEVAFRLLKPGGRLIYFAGAGLTDPRRAAASLVHPEPPASVEITRALATQAPLVIMSRG